MSCSTSSARRLLSTWRGMPLCRQMSSKRRTPLNTSRRTTNVQRSPRIAIVRPTVQFSVDQARAGGAVAGDMGLSLSLVDRLSNVSEAEYVTETQTTDVSGLDGFEQLQAIFGGRLPGAPIADTI